MYRNSLVVNEQIDKLYYLKNKWAMEIPGLVRVPFYDIEDKEHGYIVYYSEVEQTYGLIKYKLSNGEKLWTSKVVNGGYGTPVVWNGIVIVLKGFCGLAAFSKYDGHLMWEYEAKARVRSSLNIIDGKLTFSSGGNIIQLDPSGNTINIIECKKTFFFGTISKQQDHIIAMGTRHDKADNTSHLILFGLMEDGKCIYEVDLGRSHIISSDTSGFYLSNNIVIVNSSSSIYKIDANNGKIVWVTEVEGICGRHISVTDSKFIFYTTINGTYGVINYHDGRKIWNKKSNEGCIVSPPTVLGKNLFVLVDSYLMNLDKETGIVHQIKSIGHAPYSACSIFEDNFLVGGGEPPVNGILRAFCITEEPQTNCINGHVEIGNYIENTEMEINVQADKNITSLLLDASEISTVDKINGIKCGEMFYYKIPLKKNNVSGYYSLPILYNNDEDSVVDSISIYMFSKNPLPSKHIISKFNSKVVQSDVYNSGSALTQLVMKEYGKDISQDEFRKIINYVKVKSNWEDADFQTWRLILKRVLSSPAKTLEEFLDIENTYENLHDNI